MNRIYNIVAMLIVGLILSSCGEQPDSGSTCIISDCILSTEKDITSSACMRVGVEEESGFSFDGLAGGLGNATNTVDTSFDFGGLSSGGGGGGSNFTFQGLAGGGDSSIAQSFQSSGPGITVFSYIMSGEEGQSAKGPFEYIYKNIAADVAGAVVKLFEHIVRLPEYKRVISAMMFLAIVWFALRIAAQINPPNMKDMFTLLAKIVIIYAILLNWDAFEGLVVNFFESLANGLSEVFISSMLDNPNGGSDQVAVIQLADTMFLRFFTGAFWNMAIALFLNNIAVGLVVIFMYLIFAYTMLQFVGVILLCFIGRAFLYVVSVIFIPLALFRVTYDMFQGWLEMLVSFVFRQIFLVAFLLMFVTVFDDMLVNHLILNNAPDLCYVDLSKRKIFLIEAASSLLKWGWAFGDNVLAADYTTDSVINFWALAGLIMICFVFIGLIGWAEELAGILTSSMTPAFGIAIGRAMKPKNLNVFDPRRYAQRKK